MARRASRTRSPLPVLAGLFLLLGGCSGEAGGGAATAQAAPPSGRQPAPRDPRLAVAREALEAGLPDAAWTVLDALAADAGFEADLLRARASLAEGDAVGALREIESARRAAPAEAEVFATEVETLAALDRLGAAEEILRKGLEQAGRVAPLERARGVLYLRTPGRGREAVAALLKAQELDPGLPFLAFPLSRAHLLAGRAELGDRPEAALVHALAAQRFEPGNLDFRELEAEARAALLDFPGALAIFEELESHGRGQSDTRAQMHQRYATSLLLVNDRAGAAVQYAAARRLGLTDEGLGFGVSVLDEEIAGRIERGLELYEVGDFEGAGEQFAAALELDPQNLEARNHAGVIRFKERDYARAATLWEEVLTLATARDFVLPDPVHLNAARAWRLAERRDDARRVLSAYLDAQPEGEWAAATRLMLANLEAEALADE